MIYNCKHCNDEWECEDEVTWELCPFCAMPITQMIGDLFKSGDIIEMFRMIWIRIKNNNI